MKQSMILKKSKTKEVSILEYCKADSSGKIRNQDSQVQKCFNENQIVTLDGCEIFVDSVIRISNMGRVRNGFFTKGTDGAYVEVTQNCTLEKVVFYQSDFDTPCALLVIKEGGNIKIDKCGFDNSTIWIDPSTNHFHISISNCNFDCTNTKHSDRLNIGDARYIQPQNNTIIAFLDTGKRIVHLSVDGCKFVTGRSALVARQVKTLHFTNNMIKGNGNVTDDNNLNMINVLDINSLQVNNNTIKEYKNDTTLIVANACRGSICNNIIKDNTASCGIYAEDCNDLNILGNEITISLPGYAMTDGMILKGGNSYNISNNKISEMGIRAITLDKNNYHSVVSNNILAFNNKLNYEWNGTLAITNCYCMVVTGNYIHLDPANSGPAKPGFTFADNNFGLVTGNYVRGTVDMGRNNDVDMYSNKW